MTQWRQCFVFFLIGSWALNISNMSPFLTPSFRKWLHVASHAFKWHHQVSLKLCGKSWKSFGPSLHPLSQLEHLQLAPLDKTPPETQSVAFLIRDELWKQRAASKLCSLSRPLRGKSRVGSSCQMERAMTGLRAGGGDHALWMVLSTPQLEGLGGGDRGWWDGANLLVGRG